MSEPRRRFIFVPVLSAGNGTGHITRCARLASGIGKDAFMLSEFRGERFERFFSDIKGEGRNALSFICEPRCFSGSNIVVVDRRRTSKAELESLASFGIPCGIDEGGEYRAIFPFLVDTLPMLPKKSRCAPNRVSVHRLTNPGRACNPHFPIKKALVTFGGEDAYNLSGRLLSLLLRLRLFEESEITLVSGPLFKHCDRPSGIKVVASPISLDSLILNADCVFTHFGLACFEALSAGVPVVLLNPSDYHRRLSIASRIPEIGVINPNAAKLKRILKDEECLRASVKYARELLDAKNSEIAKILHSLNPDSRNECPVCEHENNPSVERYDDRSYFKCKQCGIVYLIRFSRGKKRYGEDYFFEEYKNQYGRTYSEDFENIKSFGLSRAKIIRSKLKKQLAAPSLLDVGCAFGAFLSAASESGFEVSGCDVSGVAVAQVTERLPLTLTCEKLDFENDGEESRLLSRKYDVVTMWFVIEHFIHPGWVLARVNRLLGLGGVFAFSTPNAGGISGLKNRRRFLEASPVDHRTVWSKDSCIRALARFGFKALRIRITGHHPERFSDSKQGGITYVLLLIVSRLLGLGDTFEVYARKVRDL